MNRFLPLLLFVQLVCTGWSQAQNWSLERNEDGIMVYTRATPQSSFNSFKAVMSVKASVSEVEHVLRNIDRYPDLFPDTREIRIVKRDGDSAHVQYSHTEAPWPVSDRDGVYRMAFKKDAATGTLVVVSKSMPGFLPEKEGVVRIQKSVSQWTIKPLANGMVQITYEVTAEPGGDIPDWLANSAAVDIPFETFQNLRKVLTQS